MKKVSIFILMSFIAHIAVAQTVTYSGNVAKIIYAHCSVCHHTGGLAPFPLENFTDVYLNRTNIAADVSIRKMPPWPPSPNYSRLAHERVLSQNDINTITQWVYSGAPRGDSTTEPPTPVFNNNSVLPRIDQTITIPTYTNDSSTDNYRCFAIPANQSLSKFITAIEPKPGHASMVHHILIFYDSTGYCLQLDKADPKPGYAGFGDAGTPFAQLIGVWAPGSQAIIFPKNLGEVMPAGAAYVLQIHYSAGTKGEKDSTSINFEYADTPGRNVYLQPVLNYYYTMTDGPLYIPANTTKTFHESYYVQNDVSVLSAGPHMHLIGQKIKSYAVGPAGDTIHFIDIENWNFHWQGLYNFRKLIHIKAGTTLYCEAYYDNTSNNPLNPNNPPKDVYAGEWTTDEMMLVFFGFMPYQQGDENFVVDTSALAQLAGIKDNNHLNSSSFDVYPNPAANKLTFMLNMVAEDRINLSLYDLQGHLVKEICTGRKFNEGLQDMQISLEGIASGEYLLQMKTTEGTLSKKIIVQK